MALNDMHRPKFPKILADVAVGTGEGTLNLATNSFAGRLPVNKVKFKPVLAMQYAFVAGGAYFDVAALEVVTLDAFPPGHPGILYHKAPGGATTMDVEIWN
jgi:hypothetical protein